MIDCYIILTIKSSQMENTDTQSAYSFVKQNTPEDFWLSPLQLTIPFPHNERSYDDYLNNSGMELFNTIKQKYENGQIKATIIPKDINFENAGSWIHKKDHPYAHLNEQLNKPVVNMYWNYNTNYTLTCYTDNPERFIVTSIIRFIDPDLKWIYTTSGSLYAINDLHNKMHPFFKS